MYAIAIDYIRQAGIFGYLCLLRLLSVVCIIGFMLSVGSLLYMAYLSLIGSDELNYML